MKGRGTGPKYREARHEEPGVQRAPMPTGVVGKPAGNPSADNKPPTGPKQAPPAGKMGGRY